MVNRIGAARQEAVSGSPGRSPGAAFAARRERDETTGDSAEHRSDTELCHGCDSPGAGDRPGATAVATLVPARPRRSDDHDRAASSHQTGSGWAREELAVRRLRVA